MRFSNLGCLRTVSGIRIALGYEYGGYNMIILGLSFSQAFVGDLGVPGLPRDIQIERCIYIYIYKLFLRCIELVAVFRLVQCFGVLARDLGKHGDH